MSDEAPEAIQKLISAETSCHRCGDKIEAGEYRVFVMAVEYKPEDFDSGDPAGPGRRIMASLCDVCCGETPQLPVGNLWYFEREGRAEPSAGPRSEDMSWRAQSLQGIAADRAERQADGADDGDDDSGTADIEAGLNSTNTRTMPEAEPPTEDDLRNRMSTFLRTPEARKMPRQLRTVADKWAAGETQAQIAKAMGVNQSSVSRLLDEAKAWLYKPRR